MTDRTYRAGELEHYFPEELNKPFAISSVVRYKTQPDTTVGFISAVETDPIDDAYKSLSESTRRIQKIAGISPTDDQIDDFLLPKTSGQFVYRVEWSSAPTADFSHFTMPLVRRVFPSTIANNLVSVQPMTAPSGLSFFVDYKYRANKSFNPCGEIPLETIEEDYKIGDEPCQATSQSTSGTALEKRGLGSAIHSAFSHVSTGAKWIVKQIAKLAVELISFLK